MGPVAARLRHAAVGALLPLLLLLAACEGGEPAPAPAPERTSPSAESAPSTGTPERFRSLLATATRQATTARLTVRSSGGSVQLSGEGDIDATSAFPGVEMTMSVEALGGDGVELVLLDEVLYLRVPDLSEGRFFAFDVRDPDDPLGQELADHLDPRAQLEAIDRGVQEVAPAGNETRGEERFQLYQLTVDSEEVRGTLGPDASSEEAQLPDELTYLVGFDDRSRLRRLTIELGDELGTVQMRFEDWGKAVDIRRPAADLVDPPVSAAG